MKKYYKDNILSRSSSPKSVSRHLENQRLNTMEKIQKRNQTWPVRQEVQPFWASIENNSTMISLLGPEEAIFYNTLGYEFKNCITL